MKKQLLLLASLLFLLFPAQAQEDELADDTAINMEELLEQLNYFGEVDSIYKSFNFQTGTILLGNGVASITVPEGFSYLSEGDAKVLLEELWGNPDVGETFGVLVPSNMAFLNDTFYAVVITYNTDGFIEDDDAEDIDYSELLQSMKEDTEEASKERVKMGYETIRLIGWAEPPYYDKSTHKLYWAKELSFGNSEGTTLNYNMRILGRKGYLELNAVSDMIALDVINKHKEKMLAGVEFTEGNTYADFDSDIDDIAAYGIGGLIAGKVLAKVGFFALIVKFWKFIALGVVGLFAGLRKRFKSNKENVKTLEDN